MVYVIVVVDIYREGTNCLFIWWMVFVLVIQSVLRGYCNGGLCDQATCVDDIKNGDETGVDCGGETCDVCKNRIYF